MVTVENAFRQEVKTELLERFAAARLEPPQLFLLDEVTSTMDLALDVFSGGMVGNAALIEQSPLDGVVVAALSQTKGRGRMQRVWDSGRLAGIYLSYAMESPPVERLSGLPLVVGHAVLQSVRNLGGGAGLKWPNDVWSLDEQGTPRGKLAGVLIENRVLAGKSVLVIGIGLNLERPFNVENAAGLNEILPMPVSYQTALASLLLSLKQHLGRFFDVGFSGFIEELNSDSVLTGREVRICSGAEDYFAIAGKIAPDGGLEVLLTGGEKRLVYAGDVTIKL